jgi:Ca2+-binding EF-hand superfamily protein
MILAKLRVTIQKYVNASEDFKTVAMKMFREHFRLDPDGRLAPENLEAGLKALDIPVADGDVMRLMQVLDCNIDEKLSFEEFERAIGTGSARDPGRQAAPPTPGRQAAPPTPGGEMPPTPGPADAQRDVPASRYHPRALAISADNKELAKTVFNLLDTNGDGRLDATDLIASTSYATSDMELFHGTC